MNALQIFDFNDQPTRVILRDNQPWFVAADVCRVLELSNPRDAIANLDEDEKGVGTADTLGGSQEVNLISESGLYALIFKSRKPQAKAFRKWVTSQVLPSLRQTGTYTWPAPELTAAATTAPTPPNLVGIADFIQQRGPHATLEQQIAFGKLAHHYSRAFGLPIQNVPGVGLHLSPTALEHVRQARFIHWDEPPLSKQPKDDAELIQALLSQLCEALLGPDTDTTGNIAFDPILTEALAQPHWHKLLGPGPASQSKRARLGSLLMRFGNRRLRSGHTIHVTGSNRSRTFTITRTTPSR